MEQPLLLCGLGKTGWRVLEYLRSAGLPVVAVDDHCQPDDPRLQGTPLICGDFRQRAVLLHAGVERASGVLILTNDDLINTATAMTVRSLNREVRIVLRLFNQNLLGRLGKTVQNIFALSTSLLTAPMLALTALTGQGLGSFRIEGLPEGRRQVVQMQIEPDHAAVGQPIASLTTGRDLHLLAHRRPGEYFRLLGEIQPQAELQAGDEVVLCGPVADLAPFLAVPDAGSGRSWFAGLRRQFATVWGALPESDPALRLVVFILLAIIVLGVVVLKYGAGNTVTEGLVRTLGALTTGDTTFKPEAADPLPITVFLTSLKVLGTAFVAVFTAILTNYLLRARLGQFLEARRVPEKGHVIICGLSPVGFRVVEELLQAGERAVVVERDENNRFVATLRRQGVPVIIGDATVPEVLRQVNAGTARAVVVSTNHDLLNLEIALLVRDQNEEQRVVVLQSEPTLAQMLREAANIRLAVSIHALAAPAFLAGLFGDRVLNVVLVRDRILAVVDLIAQGDDDVVLNQSLRTISIDYQMTPIALIPAGGPLPTMPLTHRFTIGDRVIGILALSDLERLLKRQRPATEYAVEVEQIPPSARPWVVAQLRQQWQCSAEEAEAKLAQVPVRLAEGLTRGQAEDLAARYRQERVEVRLIGPPPAVPVPEEDDGE